MNTIPLIFNERQVNTTVAGGRDARKEGAMDLSVILINSRGSSFRAQTLETLSKGSFASIVSMEAGGENFNVDEISRRFPDVKFIVPLEKVTDGDLINIAMGEIDTSFALVLRDNLSVPQNFLQPRQFERLAEKKRYCVVPRLLDGEGRALDAQFCPAASRGHFVVDSQAAERDGAATLYPFDSIGVYDRMKFIQLGGFDYTITSPYYQNLDLALRSWLWGEETVVSTSLTLSYSGEIPVEDTTADFTYLHFYLKNILPRCAGDGGTIAPMSFFPFLAQSSCGIFETREMFRDARRWVGVNKTRFQTDVKRLIENWTA